MVLSRILSKNRSFVSRQIAPVTVLSLISCISDYTASIIGTIIVGGAFSETGLVVTGIIAPVITLIILVCDMFSGSAVYLRSVSIAEGDEEKGSRFLGNSLVIVTIIGALMAAFLYFKADLYVSFFDLSEETFELAVAYMKAMSLHALLYMWQYYLFEILFRMEAKISVFLMVLSMSFGVAVLGLAFIDTYGIVGMAYGIIAADILTCFIGIFTLFLHRKEVKLSVKFVKPELIEQLLFGFTYSQDSFYYPIFSAVVNIFIANRFGESCIAVFAIIECICEFTSIFFGVSYAAGNHIAIYMGEGNKDGLKKIKNVSMLIQTVIGVLAMAACFIFAEPLANYMGMEEAYRVESILAVRIYSLGFLPIAYLYLICDYYCEMEKFDSCIVAYITNTLIAGIGISILLSLVFGSIGIYIGKAVSPVFGLLAAFVFNRLKYKAKDIWMIGDTSNIKSFDYEVTEDAIMTTRDLLEEELLNRGISKDITLKTMLAFEESNMLSLENNKKKIYAECTLMFKDEYFDMIIRDNGDIVDLSDTDRDVTSLRSYLVSSLVEKIIPTRHMYAASVNRMTYRFKKAL